MKSLNLKNWTLHGDTTTTPLLANTFPRGGLHFLVGEDENVNGAIVADLATALAGDPTICGLSAADESGARSLSGWFGRATGARCGVAIVTSHGRAAALLRAVTTNALARGVRSPLPIAVTEVTHLIDAPRLLHDLAPWLAERHVELGMVVIVGFEGADQRTLQAIQSNGSAVLCVFRRSRPCIPI